MSGDVQPRKRKDKRKKKGGDGIPDKQKPDISFLTRKLSSEDSDDTSSPKQNTGGPKLASDDVTAFHVHHDPHTGGHWCARIVFFILMGALVGLIGLILIENRGLTDLDTQQTESRYAEVFQGWVEEHDPFSHDDHLGDHDLGGVLDEEHDDDELEHDDDDDDDEHEQSEEEHDTEEEHDEDHDEEISEEEQEDQIQSEEEIEPVEEKLQIKKIVEDISEEIYYGKKSQDNEIENEIENEIDNEINDELNDEIDDDDINDEINELDESSENKESDEINNEIDDEINEDNNLSNEIQDLELEVTPFEELEDGDIESNEEIHEQNIDDEEINEDEEKDEQERHTSVTLKVLVGVGIAFCARQILSRKNVSGDTTQENANLNRRLTLIPKEEKPIISEQKYESSHEQINNDATKLYYENDEENYENDDEINDDYEKNEENDEYDDENHETDDDEIDENDDNEEIIVEDETKIDHKTNVGKINYGKNIDDEISDEEHDDEIDEEIDEEVDDEIDDEEEEISDVDDEELMKKLEAKYGKLPAESGNSLTENDLKEDEQKYSEEFEKARSLLDEEFDF